MEFPPMSPGIPRISPPWMGRGGGGGPYIQMTSALQLYDYTYVITPVCLHLYMYDYTCMFTPVCLHLYAYTCTCMITPVCLHLCDYTCSPVYPAQVLQTPIPNTLLGTILDTGLLPGTFGTFHRYCKLMFNPYKQR